MQQCIDNPFYAQWLFLGAGKTVISLMTADELLNTLRVNKVLIISTVHNVEATWPDEPGEWEHLQHIDITPLRGSPAKRQKLLSDGCDYHAINCENVGWLTQQYPVTKNAGTGVLTCDWPYDMVILDESGLFRNPSAKRFKYLRKMRPFIKRMIQLTGTPAPKGAHNLWTQSYLLDQGERLENTVTKFRNRWFDQNYMGWGYEIKTGAFEEITELMSDLVTTLDRDDYLDLPEVITKVIFCDLPAKAKMMYDELEAESILQLRDHTIVADGGGVLFGKMIQLANGAYYTDDKGTYSEFHDAKLKMLSQIIDEVEGQPLMIVYNYKSDAARIRQRFPTVEFMSDAKDVGKLIARWNNDEIPLLAVQPQSAGHGLNLQKGHAHGIVWFGLTPNLELYDQLNGRLDRSGQRHTTTNYLLVAKDTIDEKIVDILVSKTATQEQLMSAFYQYVDG